MSLLNQYKVLIHVRFNKLVDIDDPPSGKGCLGFYQNFGVSAPTEAIARDLAREALNQNYLKVATAKLVEVEVDEALDLATCVRRVAIQCKDPDQQCVWYKSGRIFYDRD